MLAKGFGGAERYFVDLSHELAERGHQVLAICEKNSLALQQLTQTKNLKVKTVSVWGWWDPFVSGALARQLGGFGAQVVQTHLARATYLAGSAAARLNIPLIVKTHNYVDLKYYRNVDRFIPTTIDQQNYLMERGIAPERITVIPNFSSLTPVQKASCDNVRTLIAFGRLVKKKGFDVLIKAVKQVSDQGIDIKAIIGGEGPERTALEKLINDLGLAGKVELAGWQNDIQSFLTRGDVFVLPSLDEPFGIAVLEAMACGKPIIATRTQGPSEILNEDIAFLIGKDDVPGLATTVAQAVKNPMLCQTKAESALLVYRGTYSKEVVVPNIVRIFEEISDAIIGKK